jgi:hypothetical protein
MQCARAYCELGIGRLCRIPHVYALNGRISEENVLDIKHLFQFSL